MPDVHPDFILALPVSLPLHYHGKYFKRAWENGNRLHPPYGFHASHPVARPFRHPAMGDFRLSGGASHQRTGARLSPHPRPRLRSPDPPTSQPGHCKTGILLLVSIEMLEVIPNASYLPHLFPPVLIQSGILCLLYIGGLLLLHTGTVKQ